MALVIQLPVTFTNINLVNMDGPSIFVSPGYVETAAQGHYALRSSTTSLINLADPGNPLTPGNQPPTFQSTHASITGYDQPLDTGIGIGAGLTMAIVFRAAAGAEAILCGAFGNAGNPSTTRTAAAIDGGAMIFISGGAVAGNAKYNSGSGLANSGAFAADEWHFIAYSVGPNAATLYRPRAPAAVVTGTGGDPTITTGQTVHIGNGYYNGFTGGFDVAECVVFDSALTLDQLEDLYQRSVARMAQRDNIQI